MNQPWFQDLLRHHFGHAVEVEHTRILGGGCINSCFQLQTSMGPLFIKYNQAQYLDMFEKEERGLTALLNPDILAIPKPIGAGIFSEYSYLLMEYIPSVAPDKQYWTMLGRGLARLHQITNENFGWNESNYIGRLAQHNKWHPDWNEFFWTQRLQPQIKMACDQNRLTPEQVKSFNLLPSKFDQIFPSTSPALLHGDLWSGNVMVGAQGEPVLVDPAVYYGHPEIELAFTKLFGGFDQEFYEAYGEMTTLDGGFQHRQDLYNLYPLLVHLNLFGKGYLADVLGVLKRYL